MNARNRRRRSIIAFGESFTDTGVLKELAAALRPDLPRVEPRAKPIILRRDAHPAKLLARADDIARIVRAESVRSSVAAIIVHRDLDAIEPRDDASMPNSSEAELVASLAHVAGLGIQVIATIPAWEMEA